MLSGIPGAAEYYRQFRRFPHNARLLLASTFLGSLSVGTFAVGYNLYLVELGVPGERLGYLVGAGSLASALAAIPAALLARRIGLKRLILWAAAALAVGTTLQILPWTYFTLLAGNTLGGVGGVMWAVALMPLLAASTNDAGRPYLFTLSALIFLGVTLAGNVLAGYAPSALAEAVGTNLDFGYLGVLGVTSLVSGLGLLPLLFLRHEQAVQLPPREDLRLALRERALLLKLLSIHGLIAFGAGMVIPFLNVYFVKSLGMAEEQFGLLAGAGVATRAALTVLGPLLAVRIGMARTVGATQMASIPLLLVLGFAPGLGLAAFAYLARGAIMNMAQPLRSALYMESVTEHLRAGFNSLLLVGWGVAWAAGAAIGGGLLERELHGVQFGITAGLYLLASAGLLRLFPGDVRGSGNEAPDQEEKVPGR
ncbi:MAG: MFS transporter [Chloroflexota bacterium]|nr:MFS transporter [Chloroflexota bacterium]MDP6508861.1 MFS transporter [Chloroflexota bacterium]